MVCRLRTLDFDSGNWKVQSLSAEVEVVAVVEIVVAGIVAVAAEIAVVAVGIDLESQSSEVASLQSQAADIRPDRVLQSVEDTGTQAADSTTAGSS